MLPPHLRHRDLNRIRDLSRRRMRPMRTIHQPAQLLTQIAAQPTVNRRPVHPDTGSNLGDIRTGQHRTHRVQRCSTTDKTTRANPGLPEARRPAETSGTGCRNRPLSQITWRTRVAHQSTEDIRRAAARTLLYLSSRLGGACREDA